ncbi:daxx-like protein [Teleopsis dalmanni]|uniref:daxx-like protein n=1 Tax=Teleopsis dalmanni TaxID=139649 RepID=UPI0018CE2FA4|nr:daxx-like protein [Teleopsis dalmanni]
MNSIILISDSSDEDEVPAKKLSQNVEVTPAKRAQNPLAPITRTIPSAITVTRHSPIIKSENVKSIVVTDKSNLSKMYTVATMASPGRQQLDDIYGPQKKLPQLSNLSTPSMHARKRKISTPTYRKSAVSPNDPQISNNSQPLPIITSVHSMTASDTPPRKLLATPPHTAGSLSDPIAITKPHLSPPNTTTLQINFQQQNNFDSNIKNNDNKSNCNTKAINIKTSKPVIIQDKTIRRIKPITLLQNTDDAWLKRHCTDISNVNACAEELIIPDEVEQYKSNQVDHIRKDNLTCTQINKRKGPTIPQVDLTMRGINLTNLQGSICVDDSPQGKRMKKEHLTDKMTNFNISKTPQIVSKATTGVPMTLLTVDQKKALAAAEIIDSRLLPLTSNQISSNKAAIESALTKVNAATTKGGSVSTRGGSVSTRVDSALTKIDSASSKVSFTSAKVDSATTKVDSASTRVDSASTSIDSVTTSAELPSGNYQVSPKSTEVLQNTETSACLEPLVPEFEELLQACRIADPTSDMEKLINTKLIKYYYAVHPDFVKSRGFRKTIRTTIERIREKPEFVYYNLKPIIDELKVRRKSNLVIVNNEETSGSTGNKIVDRQIKKLNKALYKTTKLINTLEESEVDFDDEDSTYLQVERYKKRACMIYEKICDLTGESKNANRLVKRPLHFQGTIYPIFNKTIQAYVNKSKGFPDYWDILRVLEHCNTKHGFGLTMFEMKPIAQEAFMKIGKMLQRRRKSDLYETVTHYTANLEDPANWDPVLSAKLSENQKHYKSIGDILEKYASKQDEMLELRKKSRLKSSVNNDNDESDLSNPTDVESESEDDEDEEEDAKVLEEHVDDLANSDISDAESDCDDHKKTEKENNLAIPEKITDSKTMSLSSNVIKQTVESQTDIIKKYDKINANIPRSKTVNLPLNGVSDNRRALETKQIPNDNDLSQILLLKSPVAKANNATKPNTVSSLCEEICDNNSSNKPTIVEKVATTISAQTLRPVSEIIISDEEA